MQVWHHPSPQRNDPSGEIRVETVRRHVVFADPRKQDEALAKGKRSGDRRFAPGGRFLDRRELNEKKVRTISSPSQHLPPCTPLTRAPPSRSGGVQPFTTAGRVINVSDQQQVLWLAPKKFRASLLWLVQGGAITQHQADRLDLNYAHRHSLTQELVR